MKLSASCRINDKEQRIFPGHWQQIVMFTSLFGSWKVRLVVFEPGL
jgi:hypothetical protein